MSYEHIEHDIKQRIAQWDGGFGFYYIPFAVFYDCLEFAFEAGRDSIAELTYERDQLAETVADLQFEKRNGSDN
jgi:hypothetical protein